MKTDQSSYPTTGSAAEKPCPSSPAPDSFEVPKVDSEEYYKDLPKSKQEPLKVARDKEVAVADQEKEKSLILAKNSKQAAKVASEAAEDSFNDERLLLDQEAKNRKINIRNDYRESLRNTLAPSYCASDDTDITKDKNVPKGQKAIKIAEFDQKLADEELWYLGRVKENQANWSLAQNNWKLAQEQYEVALCEAKATAQKAICAAYLKWRIDISKALEEANK